MPTDAQKLAAEIADLKRQVAALSRASQFARSTIAIGDDEVSLPDAVGAGVAAQAATVDLTAAQEQLAAEAVERDARLATAETDLADASTRLDAAQADITDAFGQISDMGGQITEAASAAQAAQAASDTATQDAAQAAADAAAAAQTAADAQSAAAAANQAAADAAGLADGKADVLVQDATPSADYQKASTLWIDTTGGANTPKRWTGAIWQAVTDKTAVDAANAAASAQASATDAISDAAAAQSKADSAMDAANAAQTRADDAHALAGTAQTNADAAITSASAAQSAADDAGSAANTAQAAADAAAAAAKAAKIATIASDRDPNAAGKWLFTRIDFQASPGTVPPPLEYFAATIPSTQVQVADGTNIVKNVANNYFGLLRTSVRAAADMTLSFTAQHDDGASIYVDGVQVYTRPNWSGSTPLAFSIPLTAGWHLLDIVIAEVSSNDGFFNVSPTIGSQVAELVAPSTASGAMAKAIEAKAAADAAQTSANNAAKILFSTGVPAGTAPYGSTWFQVNGTGEVVGQWQQTASGIAGTWTPRQIRSEVISNLDVGKLTAGSLAVIEAVALKIAAATASFQTVDAGNLFVSGTATVATQVAQAIWTAKLSASKIVADDIAAGAIVAQSLESVLVLASDIIAGNPAGTHALLNENGLRVLAADPDGGPPAEVVRLGTDTDDYFGVVKATGEIVASITSGGDITGQSLDIAGDINMGGSSLDARLNNAGQGLMGWASRFDDGLYWAGTGKHPYLSLQVDGLKAGRAYMVATTPINTSSDTANSDVMVNLHAGPDGRSAVVTDPIIAQGKSVPASWSTGTRSTITFNRLLTPSVDGGTSLLLSYQVASTGRGKIVANSAQPVIMTVTDIGYAMPMTGEARNGTSNAASGGSTGTETTPPPVVKNYDQTWNATGFRSYQGNGATYAFNTSRMYSGLSPAGYGDLQSIAVFPSFTSVLSGATITDVYVYVYYDFWYYGAGGNAPIVLHGSSSLPSTKPTTSFAMLAVNWPRSAGRWYRLDPATYGGFKSGAWKGFGLGGHGGGYTEYGYAHDPKIRIRYTK